MSSARFALALVLRVSSPRKCSVVTKNMFGSQLGRAALRYEKRTKEEEAIKKKVAAETAKHAG